MNDIAPVSIALWCSDIEATASFMVAAAGATVAERHPGYARLVFGAASLVLHGDEAFHGHPWFQALRRDGATRGLGVELRFNVPDVAAAHARALAVGAASVVAPYDSGAGMEAQVIGPDGYLVILQGSIDKD